MTTSCESKPASAGHADDGFTTCVANGDPHVVAIPAQSDKSYSGDSDHLTKTEPKTGLAGVLGRRGSGAGHGLVFLAITLFCLVIGMVGFLTTGKFNLRFGELGVLFQDR